jgi:ABC-type sulfate transport system permease component
MFRTTQIFVPMFGMAIFFYRTSAAVANEVLLTDSTQRSLSADQLAWAISVSEPGAVITAAVKRGDTS